MTQNTAKTTLLAHPDEAHHDTDAIHGDTLTPFELGLTQSDLDFDAASSIQVMTEQNALGDYADQMLVMANVPPGMVPGQTLHWTNAAKTSTTYTRATVEVDRHKQWIEFQLFFESGRKVSMRSALNGDVMGLVDSAGLDGSIALTTLCAQVILTYAKATTELMITH